MIVKKYLRMPTKRTAGGIEPLYGPPIGANMKVWAYSSLYEECLVEVSATDKPALMDILVRPEVRPTKLGATLIAEMIKENVVDVEPMGRAEDLIKLWTGRTVNLALEKRRYTRTLADGTEEVLDEG